MDPTPAAGGRVVGQKPKPRLLLVNFPDSQQTMVEEICALAPTHLAVLEEILASLRQREFDVAVIWGSVPPELSDELRIIVFGGTELGQVHGIHKMVPLQRRDETVSTEFIVPRGLSPAVVHLVTQLMLPVLQTRTVNQYLSTVVSNFPYDSWVANNEPFLLDGDERVIAGVLERGFRGRLPLWSIPEFAADPRWVAAALDEWAETDPATFSRRNRWTERRKWMTLAEEEAAAALAEHEAEIERRAREAEARRADLQNALMVELAVSRAGDQRLLTATGDDLVEAVVQVLRALGFDVDEVDEQIPAGSPKLEDLRVRDLATGFEALAEVKGYGSGAKTGDFAKVERFVSHHMLKHGKRPDHIWLVVNHFRDHDPDQREVPFAGSAGDVRHFAEGNGTVIDTRELFLLHKQVEGGALDKATARSLLEQAGDHFTAPIVDPDGSRPP